MIHIEITMIILSGVLILYELITLTISLVSFRKAKSDSSAGSCAVGMGPGIVKYKKGERNYSVRLFLMGVFFRREGASKAGLVVSRIIGVLMNIAFGLELMLLLISISQGFSLIIIGILLFELIIFLHEFGHFFTAKRCGVKVKEFALGMGPKILKYQKGETLYSLRLFPIGGFCSMEGEDEDSDDERSFGKKAVWKRMLIVAAGAVMNILLGLVMMMIVLAPEARFASTTIAVFSKDAPSSQTLQVVDEIKSINGYGVNTSMDLNYAFATAKSGDMRFKVKRNGETIDLDHVKFGTVEHDGKEIIQLDFKVAPIENNFGNLMGQTFMQSYSTVKMVWASLIGLLTGQFGLNEVAGPVGMTSAISQATAAGLEKSFWDGLSNLMFVMMIITFNLGVVNLLPVPALDGGRLVFLIIEAIRRKPVKPEHEGWVHLIGMILLLLFMVFISINDIIRLFTS